MARLPRRLTAMLPAAVLVTLAACTGSPLDPPPTTPAVTAPPEPAPGAFEQAACSLPEDQLRRIVAGYQPERSGDVQIVPEEPNTVGNWFSHSGPWEYLQHVPLLVYGPGHVEAAGSVDRPATLADVAPTIAELIGFDFDAPDGSPLEEALPAGRAGPPPRLVVVMVWDAAGRNVLDLYPDAWPTLRGLVDEGAWYENAEVGSTPTISGSVHATIGTGAFPRLHGVVDHWWREEGEMVFLEDVGVRAQRHPTLADLYDGANGNDPLVGIVAFDNWYLGMVGQGTYREGGDADVAVLRREGGWGLAQVSAPFFRFPEYANDVPRPTADEVDLVDGEADGLWFGVDIVDDEDFLGRMTSSGWQSRVVEEVIRREGFGADDLPDLLFTNFKHADEVSHNWTMNSPQMEGAVRADDIALGRLVETLDREVGEGEWALLVMADHGATPKVEFSGGFQIDEKILRIHIGQAFDGDGDEREVLLKQRPSQVWLDLEELEENGYTLEQVARFLAEYTRGQHAPDPDLVPEAERDDRLFAAAFPTAVLDGLRCPGS
ncbi:MAG: alkaline phosphatase family protein [Actinobacteria bacterium]|nr:alkaline phosphatase family protein [Actinomycetota bacterium]